MSIDSARAFFKKVESDKKFMKKLVKHGSVEEQILLVKEQCFDCTLEEIVQIIREVHGLYYIDRKWSTKIRKFMKRRSKMWGEVWNWFINIGKEAESAEISLPQSTGPLADSPRDDGKPETGKHIARYKCRSCGALQKDGAWEAAMDAQAKAMGLRGWHNISAKPECVKCGSLRLIDLQKAVSAESDGIDECKLPEREELIALCKQFTIEHRRYCTDNGQGSSEASRNMHHIRSKIKAIGERVGDEGGLGLMLALGESLDDPEWRSVVDGSWRGIHGWEY